MLQTPLWRGLWNWGDFFLLKVVAGGYEYKIHIIAITETVSNALIKYLRSKFLPLWWTLRISDRIRYFNGDGMYGLYVWCKSRKGLHNYK